MRNSELIAELRGLTVEGLVEKIANLREEGLRLRFKKASGPLDNPSETKRVRKSIAKATTILNEKRREA